MVIPESELYDRHRLDSVHPNRSRYTALACSQWIELMEISGNARNGRLITIAVVSVLVLLVIWQNSEVTTLSILIFSANLPLMVWLGTFLMIGFLLGVALMWSYRRRT